MLGMLVGGSYTVNLESPGCYYVGTVIHELMSVFSVLEKAISDYNCTQLFSYFFF